MYGYALLTMKCAIAVSLPSWFVDVRGVAVTRKAEIKTESAKRPRKEKNGILVYKTRKQKRGAKKSIVKWALVTLL